MYDLLLKISQIPFALALSLSPILIFLLCVFLLKKFEISYRWYTKFAIKVVIILFIVSMPFALVSAWLGFEPDKNDPAFTLMFMAHVVLAAGLVLWLEWRVRRQSRKPTTNDG